MTVTVTTIPVIDLASPGVVGQLRDALERIGFLQIVNHDVDLSMVDNTYAARDALMALPDPAKQALIHESHPFRGWKRNLDATGISIQERFQVCNIDNAMAAATVGIPSQFLDYFHPNVWPDVPGFQANVRGWFDATRALGARLMSLFALALDLPDGYFLPFFRQDVTCFAMNVYPAGVLSTSTDEPRVVLPAHVDSGTLTILHQRGDYAGLQVQTASGEWLTVPVLEDAFVINVGELMVRWTNGRWIGTRHRVVAPGEPGQSRTSLTTFYLPSVDAVIAPVVTNDDAQYAPVTPYDWEATYLSKQYTRVNGNYVPLGSSTLAQGIAARSARHTRPKPSIASSEHTQTAAHISGMLNSVP